VPVTPPARTVIRTAQPEDADAVTALLGICYRRLMADAYEPGLLEQALPLITRANPSLLASGTWFVAESEDGENVGCGGWTPDEPGTSESRRGVGHVRHFATHPEWTGRGIGRAIHEAAERQARQAEITLLVCYSSLNAVAFYEAMGFRAVRAIEVPLTHNLLFPAMLMERELQVHPGP